MRKASAFNQDVKAVIAKGPLRADLAPHLLVALKPKLLAAVDSAGHGTGRLSTDRLLSVRVALPSDAVQREIARFADSLEAKIALNEHLNETLEQIAQIIYRAWFVGFLPVRAKETARAEGRDPLLAAMCALSGKDEAALDAMPREQYKHLAGTTALFPDELVDSELGEVPRNWDVRGLHHLAVLQTSSASPAKQPDEYFEHYSIPAFDEQALPFIELGLEIKSNKYVVAHNAVLVSKLNPATPRVWLPNVKTPRAVCSTEFMQFVPRHEYGRGYLYLLMKSESMRAEILKRVTGSTGSRQRALPSQVSVLPVAHPPREVILAFESVISPMLEMIVSNREQAGTLASIRDTLVPKLLSGEIRVGEAQELVEAAA